MLAGPFPIEYFSIKPQEQFHGGDMRGISDDVNLPLSLPQLIKNVRRDQTEMLWGSRGDHDIKLQISKGFPIPIHLSVTLSPTANGHKKTAKEREGGKKINLNLFVSSLNFNFQGTVPKIDSADG